MNNALLSMLNFMSFFLLVSLEGEFFVRVLSNEFNTELRREVSTLSPTNVRNSVRLGPTTRAVRLVHVAVSILYRCLS